MRNVVAVVLGGGRGTRLQPLTSYRSKPAVPLAGKYRLIDIPLSTCLNSGINQIYVLTQFQSVSLHRHIRGCPAPMEVADGGHFLQEWGARIAANALAHFFPD